MHDSIHFVVDGVNVGTIFQKQLKNFGRFVESGSPMQWRSSHLVFLIHVDSRSK